MGKREITAFSWSLVFNLANRSDSHFIVFFKISSIVSILTGLLRPHRQLSYIPSNQQKLMRRISCVVYEALILMYGLNDIAVPA